MEKCSLESEGSFIHVTSFTMNLCPAALRPPSPTRNAFVSPVRRTMSVDGLVSFIPTSLIVSIEDLLDIQ